MKPLYAITQKISKIMVLVSSAAILLMMLLMLADITLRLILNKPIIGSFEIIEQMMVIIVFFAFGYTQIEKGHICVDVVTTAVPEKVRDILNVITSCIGVTMMGLASYASSQQIIKEFTKQSTTSTLLIPLYPFLAIVSLGVFFLGLCMLLDLITAFADLFGKGDWGFDNGDNA